MDRLAALCPLTLTEIDAVFFASSLEEARQSVDAVTLPCPIRVRCKYHVSLSGSVRSGRGVFAVDTDKTFRPDVFVTSLEDSIGIDQVSPDEYVYPSNTLTRIVLIGLTMEWLNAVNALPNLLSLTIKEEKKTESLYLLTTPKLKSLSVAIPARSRLLVYKLPSTLTKLEVSRGDQASLHFESVPALKTLITAVKIKTPLPASLQRLLAVCEVNMSVMAGCSELRRLTFSPMGDVVKWPESLVELKILHTNNVPLPNMSAQLPKRLRRLTMYLPQVPENVTKWSLSGLDTVQVAHSLTKEQLDSFTGYFLTSANTEQELDVLRHSQRKRTIKGRELWNRLQN